MATSVPQPMFLTVAASRYPVFINNRLFEDIIMCLEKGNRRRRRGLEKDIPHLLSGVLAYEKQSFDEKLVQVYLN